MAAGSVILIVVLLGAATGAAGALFGGGGGQPVASPDASADIPAGYLGWYRHAAADACPGLPWTVLAAVGKIESDHGRSMLPGVHIGTNLAGAKGPMQFLQTTFDHYATPVPPAGTVPPSPYDPPDAIWAAARMLCANGANRNDLHAALFAYNHSTDYVEQVLRWADRYTAAPAPPGPPNQAAGRAIAFATEQLGLPYVWGGNGPAHGDAGFDCSGLTTAAYAAAGIDLPRTAQSQYDRGPLLPADSPPSPGDLLFYGTSGNVHHVGLYIGNGRMIDAPDFGKPVQIENYRWAGDDFLAATRPIK